eukprot:414071_1
MSYYNRGGKRKSHPKKRRQKHKNKNKTNNLPAAKDAKIEQPISSQSPDNIQPQHNNNNNNNNINVMEEMYAKNVYGCDIKYYYDNTNDISYITSIQLFYDNINLNGTIVGDNSININQTRNVFHSEYCINSVLLWYNLDKSVAAIQFKTVNSETESEIFGYVNSNKINDFVTINSDNFVLGGYNVYYTESDRILITGFDFLFYEKDNQWSSTLGIRIVIFSVFVWWFGWQIITLFTMKKRVKISIPSNSSVWTISAQNTWNILTETFSEYKYIRNMLIAWFFYSDALGSMTVASVLFASIELNFSAAELGLMLLEYEICAAVGNIIHLFMQKKLGWNCKQMVLYHLIIYSIIPWYVAIGLIPNAPFGLISKWELWLFAFIYSIQLGSLQGFGRALVSSLIPIGKENKIFSLYAITDKGSSWIGPLLMGFLADKTELRWGMLYIIAFLWISLPFIWNIDLIDGMKQAGKLEEKNIQITDDTSQSKNTIEANTELNTVDDIETEMETYMK